MDKLIQITTDAQGASVVSAHELPGVVHIRAPFVPGGKLLLGTEEDPRALQLPDKAYVQCQEVEDYGQLKPSKAYVFETAAAILVRRFDGIVDGVVQLSSVKPGTPPDECIPLAVLHRVYSVEWKSKED